MGNEYYGSAVVDGKLRYSSVSQIRLADKRTKGGCLRRWWYDKVARIKEVDSERVSDAKEAGIDLDVELKQFLRSGDSTALSALAMKGLHILPVPGKDLGLDVKMHHVKYVLNGVELTGKFTYDNRPPDGTIITIGSALMADDVPVVGELDVCHNRGLNRGDEDDEDGHDPEGTVEVFDIKRKGVDKDRFGNKTYMESSELVHDIQMGGYGEWVGRVYPPTKYVRLSHGYFFAKGKTPPKKVTRLHVLDECKRTWDYASSVVRSMKEYAGEEDVNKVPFNVQACDAFAGCGHRDKCQAYKNLRTDTLYGRIAEDHVKESEKKEMGILAENNLLPGQQTAPVVDQRAQLEAETAALKAQQQALQAQPSLLDAWTRIEKHGRGLPALGGNAAQAFAQAKGYGPIQQGAGYAGGGALAAVVLMEPQHIFQLLSELDGQAPQQPVVVQMNPAQAPISGASAGFPTLQQMPSGPVAGLIPPAAQSQYVQQPIATIAPPSAMQPMNILAPNAPVSQPQLAMQQPAPTPAPVVDPTPTAPLAEQPAAPAPRRRGRPKNADAATQTTNPPVATAAGTSVESHASASVPVGDDAETAEAGGGLSIPSSVPACIVFIDCIPSMPYTSLTKYIDELNHDLAKRYSVNEKGEPGVQDVRCVPKNSVLAYGGWKGAVHECVLAKPPAPGLLYIDTRHSDLAAAVADALVTLCARENILCVKG
jgi:hypothetical protein